MKLGMPGPRAVVIPFGVPDDGRGLGLGLAAMVHSFARIDGESVALAQLLSRSRVPASRAPLDEDDEGDEGQAFDIGREAGPVEAFVPPRAWKDLAGGGPEPLGVRFVVTGSFEPPTDGRGLIQLLVFEAKDGRTRARVEAHVDGENAGRALLAALDELWSQLDGELGTMRDIGDLSWDALESVLRAERCALHDPLRGGPHDHLAAMVHLGRAIGDAPDARFPASRLASLALDVATLAPADGKLADAALRALVRATADAPKNPDLCEALAALTLRVGNGEDAESRVLEALALDSERPRLYALLSEARRARGDLPGALCAIEDGLLRGTDDPLLNTERGIVLAKRGHPDHAERAWRMVLEADPHRPLYPPAFINLASSVMERKDAVAAAHLVDDALTRGPAHPDVLKRAIQLSLAVEPEGIARAARVGKLAHALVERVPNDAWANLMLARSFALTGDKMAAARRLSHVEALAPASSLAADAQRARLALEEPQASLEIDATLRAAYQAPAADLETLALRPRKGAVGDYGSLASWAALGLVRCWATLRCVGALASEGWGGAGGRRRTGGESEGDEMSEVDWTLYLRAPAFDVAGGVGLGHGLLVALPKAMPATVKAAAKKLRHDVDALKEAWRPAVFKAKEERVDLRSLDTKYDATWRAVRDRLVAVDVLDDELDAVEKVDAKLLYESLFGGGSEFLNGQGKKQWAACEARIDALEKAGLVTKVEHVVGAPYWRQLKTQHEAYGQATGATKAVAADDPSTSLLGPLRDLQRSMGDYLLQIVAAVKNDATLETHARAAVAPVDEHRASAVRAGKSTAPAVTPDTPTPEIPID